MGGLGLPMAEASRDQHMEADVKDADKELCRRLQVHMVHPFRAVIVERLNAPPVEYIPLGLVAEGCFLRFVSRFLVRLLSSVSLLLSMTNSVWAFHVTKAANIRYNKRESFRGVSNVRYV